MVCLVPKVLVFAALFWNALLISMPTQSLFLVKEPMLSYSAVVCRFVTPRTVAHQAPLSMGLLRQEYWSGFPFPPQEDLLDPGIEPASPELKVDSLPLWHLGCPASSRLNTNSSGRHSFTHWTRSHKFFYFLSLVAKFTILLAKSLNDLLNIFLVKWSKTCHFKLSLILEMVVFIQGTFWCTYLSWI